MPPLITLSPNSPKTPTSVNAIAPIATAALITFNTPPASPVFDMSASAADAFMEGASVLNNNVTVTHFSEQRGGVVEKISVPGLNIYSHEMSSPKLDNPMRAQQATPIKSNNPFINSPASPVLSNGAASTNPFLRSLTEADAENNNNNHHHVTNGRNGSVARDEDSEEDNLDVKVEDKTNIIDKNPFRDGEVKATNVTAAEDKNGNRMEKSAEGVEIVTVSEIDGGRVAEIIKVSARKAFTVAFDIYCVSHWVCPT